MYEKKMNQHFQALEVPDTYPFPYRIVLHKIHGFYLHLFEELGRVIECILVFLKHRGWIYIVDDLLQQSDAIFEVVLIALQKVTTHFFSKFN